MGKSHQYNLQQQHRHEGESGRGSSGLFCEGCSVALNRVTKDFSFKCFFVLVLSLSVFVSGIFWILPFHSIKYGFDARDAIKLSATVQAYFRLDKPVSQLVPHIGRLEYDIFEEITIPGTKVAILSMHQSGASNWTDVVFGVLSDPIDVPINPVFLSLLRLSLIDLFLQQSNLTLTSSIFGTPSKFEILKFPGGVTVIPVESASIWLIPEILFNFTLNNSISDILENFVEFKDQLKLGLNLRSYENVYVQITNKIGSTRDQPVTVQASVMSDLGSLLPQRLKQLAQTITGSPEKNLGLDNTVFGKVKSISLCSYLNGTLHSTPPPSPAPSPEPSISPHPPLSPSDTPIPSPAPSMVSVHPPHPCPNGAFKTSPSPSPTSHPNPTAPTATPYSPPTGPISQLSPDLSPVPEVSHGSRPGQDKESAKGLVSPALAPSPSSVAVGTFYKEIWLLGFSGLFIFHLFCWSD